MEVNLVGISNLREKPGDINLSEHRHRPRLCHHTLADKNRPQCSKPLILLLSILPPQHLPSTRSTLLRRTMTKDYGNIWNHVIGTTDEGGAVRALAEILADKEGRDFVFLLGPEDSGLCAEI